VTTLDTTAAPVAGGPADRAFDAAGVRLRYLEQGDGPPVVLLHCFAGDVESQFVATGLFAALARDHRVLGLDLRGHGKSGKPHDPRCYGAELARDVVRLLDHARIERAHVVGYSMGAHVTAQLLTLAPARFITATLGGACGRRCWTPEDDARVEREAAELEHGSMRAQILRLWPRDLPLPGEDEIAARAARYLAGKDALALAAARRANRGQVVTDAQMAAVTVPTLGIVGSQDPYLALFCALTAVMPALSLTVIPGATHADAAARPEFARALRAFIAAHAARER
jgi:pimeloyl-ACP methyl ester carboxylesterase